MDAKAQKLPAETSNVTKKKTAEETNEYAGERD